MKLRLLTLFSIIVALAVKTYTINAQDGVIDDEEVEMLANWELKTKSDTIIHEKHVNRIVDVLAESAYVSEESVGIAMVPSETYHQYANLKKAANSYELNKLMIHDSPIIRVYAHRALMENKMELNIDNVQTIANDSTAVTWMDGDRLVQTTVMDMVTENLFHPELNNSNVEKAIAKL